MLSVQKGTSHGVLTAPSKWKWISLFCMLTFCMVEFEFMLESLYGNHYKCLKMKTCALKNGDHLYSLGVLRDAPIFLGSCHWHKLELHEGHSFRGTKIIFLVGLFGLHFHIKYFLNHNDILTLMKFLWSYSLFGK